MVDSGFRLGIDFGTSNTVAVLRWPDGRAKPLLFDGSPLLPSAVYIDPDGVILSGRDAVHSARLHPHRFEPYPKRRIEDGTVWLGDRDVSAVDLIAAVLRRVATEAQRVAGAVAGQVTVTHPASWGPSRRQALSRATAAAGLPAPQLAAEPVAAASYFVGMVGAQVPVGGCAVVYDFGAGTFDASVVRRTAAGGFEVLANEGLPDAGGLDVDAAIMAYLGKLISSRAPEQWQRLSRPESAQDRRAAWQLWEDVRQAKEMLSRATSAYVQVPLVDDSVPVGREQLEQLARPTLDRTVTATGLAVASAGLSPTQLSAIFLVGGSSRIPLAATLLHRAFEIAPTAIEQPELVVAEGALRLAPPTGRASVEQAPAGDASSPLAGPRPASPPAGGPATAAPTAYRGPGAPVAPVSGVPVSGGPVSGGPVSGRPVSGGPVSGGPVSGGPVSGEPVPGGPVRGPVRGVPAPAGPTSGGPVSGRPAAGGPVTGGPVVGRPVSGGPVPGIPARPGPHPTPPPGPHTTAFAGPARGPAGPPPFTGPRPAAPAGPGGAPPTRPVPTPSANPPGASPVRVNPVPVNPTGAAPAAPGPARGRLLGLVAGTVTLIVLIAGVTTVALWPAGSDGPPEPPASVAASPACGYKIAYLGPLTENPGGQAIRNAAQLAVEQYNSRNASCTVTLAEYDTYDPGTKSLDLADERAKTIVTDSRILGVVGPLYGTEATDAVPVFEAAGLPVVSPAATESNLTRKGWTVFHRTIGADRDQAAAAVRYLQRVMNVSRTFVVDDGTEFGVEIGSEVNRLLGPAAVRTSSFDWRKTTDFTALVKEISTSGADSVYYAGYGKPGGAFVKALRAAQPNIAVLAGDRAFSQDFIDGAGEKAAEGVVITALFVPPSQTRDNFAGRFNGRFGDIARYYGAEAFDAMNVLLAGLHAGKSTRSEMLGWVKQYRHDGVSRQIRFSPSGELDPSGQVVWAFRVSGGRIRAESVVAA